MTRIAMIGQEQALLRRWSEQANAMRHDCVFLSAEALARQPLDADLCLYDLGPRGAADTRLLMAAAAASPNTRFVAMTAHPEPQEGLRLLRSGVRGYANRLMSLRALQALLETVLNGEIWAGRQVTDYLLGQSVANEVPDVQRQDDLVGSLTAREAEIAEQVAAGLSNKVIAIENGISERTVKAHLNAIFRKTGIRNRVQLALAVTQGEEKSRKRSNG